uniref:Aminoglycoside phosphotransferase domain-containing protein n=1 Tax=Colletotrichum fructicola (strain Nara gc5) TaxID=1213859 RepID=L2G8B8_COLFN
MTTAIDVGADETRKVAAFLARRGLSAEEAVPRMHEFARGLFPGCEVVVAPFQGYCSYTLLLVPLGQDRDSGCEVGDERLVQFRPRKHGIDVGICGEARKVLGGGVGVPVVEELGVVEGELVGYVVERIGGVSLAELRRRDNGLKREMRRRVVKDLAGMFADSRRDAAAGAKGKIGGSLRWRLDVMAKGLPRELRGVVRRVMREMDEVEGLGWVVTHGDLVSDNIMVKGDGGVVGLIDWAEAEWLPFGVGMYGLEEVLGQDVIIDEETGRSRFEYYPEARELRDFFWEEVGRVVDDEDVLKRAKWAQVLGVLLWRGIAFDDGDLGRVVDERDWWDLQRLRTWLFDERGLGMRERWWERVWREVKELMSCL